MTTATVSTVSVDVLAAATEYRNLRDRTANPVGKFDGAGRFYLEQYYDCCRGIRSPSRAYPYSEMVHGRTAEHVAHAHSVDVREVRRVARQMDAAERAAA